MKAQVYVATLKNGLTNRRIIWDVPLSVVAQVGPIKYEDRWFEGTLKTVLAKMQPFVESITRQPTMTGERVQIDLHPGCPYYLVIKEFSDVTTT